MGNFFDDLSNNVRDAFGTAGGFLGLSDQSYSTSGFQPSASENEFIEQLKAQMKGQGGPSPAELQMRAALDQANGSAMATAASQRGVSPALAARMAAQQQASNGQAIAQQSGVLRAGEQQNSQNLMGQMYASQRQSAGQANQLSAQAQEGTFARRGGLLNGLAGAAAQGMMMMAGGGKVPSISAGPSSGGYDNALHGIPTMNGTASQPSGNWGFLADLAKQQGGGGGVSYDTPGYLGVDTGGAPQNVGYLGAMGGASSAASPSAFSALTLKSGGPIPGQAKVAGDSLENDTVPILASPGEVMLPRSVTQSPDAPEKAKEFLEHLMQTKKKPESKGYAGVAEAKRKMQDAMDHLSKMGA